LDPDYPSDFICDACASKWEFLDFYHEFVAPSEKSDEATEEEKKPAEHLNPESSALNAKRKLDDAKLNEMKKRKVEPEEQVDKCILKTKEKIPRKTKTLFMEKDWKNSLCRCGDCLQMYQKLNCQFLLEEDEDVEIEEEETGDEVLKVSDPVSLLESGHKAFLNSGNAYLFWGVRRIDNFSLFFLQKNRWDQLRKSICWKDLDTWLRV
jgi:hypothetical protein